MSLEERDFYTVQEVASRLSFKSDETVRRMIKRGELKAYQLGRQWRIPADEYERVKSELLIEVEPKGGGDGVS
ncbi:MAG: helix-turn-helix domain-containing protein [Desulfovibrio sp.]